MEHSKKYFVIDEAGLQKIREALPPESDTPLKKFNQAFIENKMLDKNIKDKSWAETKGRVVPIISEGIKKAVEATSFPIVSTPSAKDDDDDDEIMLDLETGLGVKYRNKGIKLYHLLKRIPGVTIRKNGIEVDGYKIRGSSANIITNLAKNTNMIAYESVILLQKAIDGGYGELVRNLISNKEAKKYLDDELGKEPGRTSTPRSGQRQNLALSGIESDDDTFKEAHDQTDPVLGQRGSNKRIKWISLFDKKRKTGLKQNGGKLHKKRR